MKSRTKWTILGVAVALVLGIALLNWASTSGYGPSQAAASQNPSSYAMGGPSTGQGAWGQMGQWFQRMWSQMASWMGGGGGMGGGMGAGMMGGYGSGAYGRMGGGMMGGGMGYYGQPGQATQSPQAPSSSTASDTAAAVNVQIENYAFSPAEIHIKVGQTVTWTNHDSVGHNIVFDQSSQAGTMMAQGQSWSYTFTEPGTYSYHCGPHPFMTGQIVVENGTE